MAAEPISRAPAKTRRIAGAVAVVVLAALFGRLSWFSEPYGISVDESTYMAMGDIVARGGIPYRDALDRKPPGLFWMFSMLGKAFGPWNIHAVHGVAFLMTLLLCLAAAGLERRLDPDQDASLAAPLLFALYSAGFTREIISCNAEDPMLLACAGVALCLTSSRPGEPVSRSALLAGLAGVLAALATLFKQYGILVCVAMALAWAAVHRRTDRAAERSGGPERPASPARPAGLAGQRLLLTSATFLVATSAVLAGVALWFYRAGALKALCDWAVLDGFRYMHAGWRARSLKAEVVLSLAGIAVAWVALWLGAGRTGPWRKTLAFPVLLSGGVAAISTTLLSGRSFAHYHLPIAWFASVLAAPGLRALWRAGRHRVAVTATVVVPLTFFAVLNTARDHLWAGAKFNRARQAQLDRAARWIRDHAAVGETIAVWGSAAQLYVMSGRGSGTRHVFADFVSGRQPGFDSGTSVPMPGALASYLADLEHNRPAVFVDTSPAGINDYGHFPLRALPALEAYLRQHYCLAATVASIDLWLRRRPGRAGQRDPACEPR